MYNIFILHNFIYDMFYAIHCMHFDTILSPTGRVFSIVSQYGTINTTGVELEILQENYINGCICPGSLCFIDISNYDMDYVR